MGHLVAVMGHLVAFSISLVKVGQCILCAITNFCFHTWAKWGGGRGVLLNVPVLVRLMPVLRSIDWVIKMIVPINSRWNVEQQEPLSLAQCSLFMTFNGFFHFLAPWSLSDAFLFVGGDICYKIYTHTESRASVIHSADLHPTASGHIRSSFKKPVIILCLKFIMAIVEVWQHI